MNLPLRRTAQTPQTSLDATASSGFQRWLRRWSGTALATPANKPGRDDPLDSARALIQEALAEASPRMGARDLRVYLRLLSEPSLSGLQRLRFDCFDLMCRHLSEAEAVQRLRHLDACWQTTAGIQSTDGRWCK